MNCITINMKDKKLKDREEIIKNCKEKPFLLVFAILGCYDDLSKRFKTGDEAIDELNELLYSYRIDIKEHGYFAEISKSIFVETKD